MKIKEMKRRRPFTSLCQAFRLKPDRQPSNFFVYKWFSAEAIEIRKHNKQAYYF